MAKMKRNLQILVSDQDYDRIKTLSERHAISMGGLLRKLATHAWMHECAGTPTCPDGQRCYVPQMHAATHVQAPPSSMSPGERPSQA